MRRQLRSIFQQSTFYKDAQNLISISSRFKPSLYNEEDPKLDPFSTNEIWLNWLKACDAEKDVNEHLNVGIQIIGIQQKFDRSIKKSYKQLSNYVQNNVDQFSTQQLNNYLELANTTYLNEQTILSKIYDRLAQEKQHNFRQLVTCANLQCHDMELVSSQIDLLHDSIESQELGQYLYALLILIPNEQSSILINLVESKIKDLEYIEPTILLKQVALVLKQLYTYKNREIPKALHNLCISKNNITMRGQPSLIQKEIQVLLNMVKINYIQEYQVQDLYQVDFYLCDNKQILEVNGPQHYVYDIETKNPTILKGKDYFKAMVLQSLGYQVRNLCYKDFYNAKGVTKKLQLLKELI